LSQPYRFSGWSFESNTRQRLHICAAVLTNRRDSFLSLCECRARLSAAIFVAERARPYEAGGFASETWLLWATFKSAAEYRVAFSAGMPSRRATTTSRGSACRPRVAASGAFRRGYAQAKGERRWQRRNRNSTARCADGFFAPTRRRRI